MMTCRILMLAALGLCFQSIAAAPATKPALTPEGSSYLFVWAGNAARQSTDFLAVIDARQTSPKYGRIVSSLPVDAVGSMPHHTEYEFPAGNLLFANSWVAGRTFLIDLRRPSQPRLQLEFRDRDGFTFPHSFIRLPNGHVLATFQSHGQGYAPGGGLVELDENGSVVQSASAVDPAIDKNLIWPYSAAIVPQLGLAVSSSTPMGGPDWAKFPPGSWPLQKINDQVTAQVQIWRLSRLQLLHTISLPSEAGGKHNQWPAEPRLLPDGTVYVNTFSCGLYRMKDLSSPQPSAELVYTFPGGDSEHTMCAVPVVVGHYWIQTVAALPGLIALDVSHPDKPVEVSRIKFDSRFAMPHWLAADRKSDRLAVTGDGQSWLLVARLNPVTGALSLDQTFRDPGATSPGVSFDRQQWPHGKGGRAIVHGALFGQ